MLRTLAVALVLIAGCKKGGTDAAKTDEAQKPAVTAPAKPADGPRKVAIAVDDRGYTPDKIAGKPGEPLVLVFKRTMDASCIAQLKAPDGKMVDLPMNTPVEVPVTVPQTGQVGFACGMDMFHGVVVAQQ
jgi:plastocyanin domain-containing protein